MKDKQNRWRAGQRLTAIIGSSPLLFPPETTLDLGVLTEAQAATLNSYPDLLPVEAAVILRPGLWGVTDLRVEEEPE